MDHRHYRYSPLPARPQGPLAPDLHTFVLLHLEHWDFEAPEGSLRDPRFVGEFGSFNPDWRSWSQREYGLRIGAQRVIDVLAGAGIAPAVAANALVLPRVPELVASLRGQGAEWVGHGLAATRMMHSGQPLEVQRDQVQTSLQALATHTGEVASGWLSQDWGTSPHTYGLLADAGLAYTLDWGNDDQPYWMEAAGTVGRRLLAVPFSSEWDDVQCQWLRHIEPWDHAQLVLDAARRLARECEDSGRGAVLGLGLHPWVWGMASRITHLRQLLADLHKIPNLHWTQPRHIAQMCGAQSGPATSLNLPPKA
jgi:allantoinase